MTTARRAHIAAISAEATEWRRALHQHPQTMYEETFARELIASKLTEWGIAHEVGIAQTGVVATIPGRATGSGRVVAFRADIDALDITEETGLPWASTIPGKMHACGHDGHTAILLALARYLNETRQFAGTVRLIFQPAEEGGRGAERMLAEGLLERLPYDEIYGLHNWPFAPTGHFAICTGRMMAATDFFEIHLTGRGGHAAMPHACDDLVLAGSHLVSAMQAIVAREVPALDPAVLSITNFQAGTNAANVLPTKAWLSGTVRTFSEEVRRHIETRMATMVAQTAQMFRLESSFSYNRITDTVLNEPQSTEYAREAVRRCFGDDRLHGMEPVLGGEDFGSFMKDRPGAFIVLGQAAAETDASVSQGVHTPRYDFNDAIIPLGVEYFAELAESRLPLEAPLPAAAL